MVVWALPATRPLGAQAPGRGASDARATIILRGRVVAQDAVTPAPYSGVELAETRERRLAAPDGSFSFKVAPGRYHVRVRQLGFAPRDTSVLIIAGAPPPELVIRMAARSILLSTVKVTDPGVCQKPGVDSLDEPILYGILAAVRENAARELILRRTYPFEFTTESVLDTAVVDSAATSHGARGSPPVVDTLRYRSDSMPPYASGEIVFVDVTDWRGARERMRLPSTVDFANDAFISTHCFNYKSEESGEYAVYFRPVASLRAPDVEGKVTLDSLTYVIRSATFRLTHPELVAPGFQRMEVSTTYREAVPRIAVAAEITATQTFRIGPPADVSHRVSERQTTQSLRFLGPAPTGISPVLEFRRDVRQRAAGVPQPQSSDGSAGQSR